MKKIGILTLQSAKNYGAVLQNYALFSFLQKKYGDTVVIDYHNDLIDSVYNKPKFTDVFHNPKKYLSQILQYHFTKEKNNKITAFTKEYIKYTEPCKKDNIKEICSDIDKYVVGSDQVWNPLIIGSDNTFFLDFVNDKNKKLSYAASIGLNNVGTEDSIRIRNFVNDFLGISVREKEGKEILEKVIKKDVFQHVDPTFLLPTSEWKKISKKPNTQKKYVLMYKITKEEKLYDFAKKLAKKEGLELIVIPNHFKDKYKYKECKILNNVGVEEWLGYIENAEYVVTNSFHGTVFSILFNKKFFSEIANNVNPSTSRLNSLLSIFDLSFRSITNFSESILNLKDDFNVVESEIVKFQEQASKYFDFYIGDVLCEE